MSSLKFTLPAHWDTIEAHLTHGHGERFAFALTRQLADSPRGPILEVVDVELIGDGEIRTDATGSSICVSTLDRVHNLAIATGCGLVEFHNHHLGAPGFSRTDEEGLTPMADYVTGLLTDRPYGAGVYANGRVHVEHWRRTPTGLVRARFDSVLVLGDHLRLLNAPAHRDDGRLVRQTSCLGMRGNATLTHLRVALVGAGGTGSHVALALAYLGIREVIILDDDVVEESNLNRLVSAGIADLGAPKVLVARRRMREVDPGLSADGLPGVNPNLSSAELDDVDLIISCVDHDGPRDRLNQLAVETATPYIDIAVGNRSHDLSAHNWRQGRADKA